MLDCGANVGTFTRKALQAGAKLVVAIELEPRNYSCLRRNFEREIRDGRVIVVTKGVWDKDDTLRFYAYHNAALGSVVMTDRPQSGELASSQTPLSWPPSPCRPTRTTPSPRRKTPAWPKPRPIPTPP